MSRDVRIGFGAQPYTHDLAHGVFNLMGYPMANSTTGSAGIIQSLQPGAFTLTGQPMTFVPAPPGGSVWPQMAAYMLQANTGSNSYNNPRIIAYLQHLNSAITGCYDGWESFGIPYDGTHSGSMHAFTQAAQNGSLQPGGTILLADYDAQVLNPNICANNQVANNMDLLTVYPGGSHVLVGANHAGNICTVGAQPTFGGRNSNTYNADYAFDHLANGGGLGLAGNAVSANPTLNGWFLDDTNPFVPRAGDYLRNGTTQSADSGTGAGGSAASLAIKSAYGTMMARIKANKPGALVFANLSGFYPVNVNLTNFPAFDGGVAEHAMGTANSKDSFSDWFALMTFLALQKSSLKPGGTFIVAHDGVLNNGTDFYRNASPYQASRYGLITSLCAQGQWAPNPAGPQPNMTASSGFGDYSTADFGSWLWPDEMAVNPNSLIAYAYGDPNINLGLGWRGTEIDTGVVTTIWQNGCVRKRYQMANGRQAWDIINPSKTTAATVTYGQRMQAFTGTQAPSVNSGNTNITSETIPPQDGRTRITYP